MDCGGPSEILQVDPDADQAEAAAVLDAFDAGAEEFAGVHQPCKNQIVFLGDVAQLAAVRREQQDSVAVKFVVFAAQGQFVAFRDLFQYGGVLKVAGPGDVGVEQVDLADQGLQDPAEALLVQRRDECALLSLYQFICHCRIMPPPRMDCRGLQNQCKYDWLQEWSWWGGPFCNTFMVVR